MSKAYTLHGIKIDRNNIEIIPRKGRPMCLPKIKKIIFNLKTIDRITEQNAF